MPSSYAPPESWEWATIRFYQWERRGRGWYVFPHLVRLEPDFTPFFHDNPIFAVAPPPVVDDGLRPTLLQHLFGAIKGAIVAALSPGPVVEAADDLSIGVVDDECFSDVEFVVLRLAVPAATSVRAAAVEAALLALQYCTFPVSFEVVGTADAVTINLVCQPVDASLVRQHLTAYLPDVTIEEVDDPLLAAWDFPLGAAYVDFGLAHEFMRPIGNPGDVDPLAGIVAAMDQLQWGEAAVFQVIFRAARNPWGESALRAVTDAKGGAFFADAPEMVPLAKRKVAQPLFAAVVRAAANSRDAARPLHLVRAISAALTPLADPASNELIPLSNEGLTEVNHRFDLLARKSHRVGMLLNCDELRSLVHPPSAAVRSKKLVRSVERTKAPPPSAVGHALVLGTTIHQGHQTSVTLAPDQRARHLHVIGATGTGKSTLLANLIAQDLEQGNGLCLLDPHGDLADRVVAMLPKSRLNDVILFDPSDTEAPVGFNILATSDEIEKAILTSDLVGLFRRYTTSWGDQMTAVMANAIMALVDAPKEYTLADLRRFLVEREYRAAVLASVSDEEIRYYWDKEFPLLRGNPQASILTRLNTFLRPKAIRNVVTQTGGLDINTVVNGGKVLVCKLSHGLIGEENGFLLGTLLVSKIHQVIMARAALHPGERRPFYLYIDEFHHFVTPSLNAILSGARKYGLGLILAQQELRQLASRDTDLAAAVIGNAGTRVCFRVAEGDAGKLAEGFDFFDAADLKNLPTGQAICRIERSDHDFKLTVAEPPPIDPAAAQERMSEVVAVSRERYGRAPITQPATEEAEVTPFPPTVRVEEQDTAVPAASAPVEPGPMPSDEGNEVAPKAPSAEAPTPTDAHSPSEPERPKRTAKRADAQTSQHRYLQELIRWAGEDNGFLVVLEQPILEGRARVDVSLERDGQRIAVEISVTSTGKQEVEHILACLEANYALVVACSPEERGVAKVRKLAEKTLTAEQQSQVRYLLPDEVIALLAETPKPPVPEEERIKGYRVKMAYKPDATGQGKAQGDVVSDVVRQAMKRLRGRS